MFPHTIMSSTEGLRMAGMSTSQQFCLRWNNHQSNMMSVFEHLLQSELFTDVSVAVEGRTLKAHKMVLSACSPYFQAVLSTHPEKHPIVILKDIRYTDMRDLLDFMYRGEVSVDQENLSTFLRVAQSLRIKGLTEVGDKRGEPYLIQGPPPSSSPNSCISNLGSIAIAPPSTLLPGAPSTPLPGDPPPLKRPPLSPTATGAKRRRGRPPKISGEEESETEVGVSHDEESRSCSGGAGSVMGIAVETEIKMETEETSDHQKDGELSRPPSQQTDDVRAGPSGELIPRDLTNKNSEENNRQSPGSGHPPPLDPWRSSPSSTLVCPPLDPPAIDPDDSNSTTLSSSLGSHPSPLSLVVSPLPKHGVVTASTPSPAIATTDIVDQRLYTNLLEAAMRSTKRGPYDSLPAEAANNLHGSILLASLKYGAFPGVYPASAGDREAIEREYLESSPHSPHTSPQKPSQSTTSLPSPGAIGQMVAGSAQQSPPIPSSGAGGNFNGNRSPHNTSTSSGNNGNGNERPTGKGVSVPIMSYCIQDNGFKCSKCFQTFTHPSNFHRHYITVHTDRRNHKCSVCGKEFKRKDNMMSHMRSVHRPGRESHSIYRDVSSVTPSLAYDMNTIKCEKVQPPMIGQ